MIEMISAIIKDNYEVIKYLFFGVLTVIVNTIVFMLAINQMEPFYANLIAFLIAVIFAYITNTVWVFNAKIDFNSLVKFTSVRLGTLLIDTIILMTLLNLGSLEIVSKTIANIVVIILNYVLSKCYVYSQE